MVEVSDHKYNRVPTEISNAEEFKEIAKYDHAFCKFKNIRYIKGKDGVERPEILEENTGWSLKANFQEAQCIWFDIDNGGLKPEEYTNLEHITNFFKELRVNIVVYTSKSHMKEKFEQNGECQSARPKYHGCIPTKNKMLPDQMDIMIERIRRVMKTSKHDFHCDEKVFEKSRHFSGSGPNVEVWWNENGLYFDELDFTKFDKEEVDEKIISVIENKDKRKLSSLEEKFKSGENIIPGAGRCDWIRTTAESLYIKTGLNWREVDWIIKKISDTWSGGWTPQNKEDRDRELQSARRYSERIEKEHMDILDDVLKKYDEKYAVFWFGSVKTVYNKSNKSMQKISDLKTQENTSQEDSLFYRGYDPDRMKVVLKAGHKFDYWLEKRMSEDVTYTFDPSLSPGRVEDKYNVFSGFGVEPIKGDWRTIRHFLYKVICNSNMKIYSYLLDFLAAKVQHPEILPRVSLSLYSHMQRTGKGTFYDLIVYMFGQENCVLVNSSKRVTQQFNSLMENKLWVALDECIWGGSIEDAQMLKSSMVTVKEPIEKKGIDMVVVNNYKSYLIFSNKRWHTPVEPQNKRHLCIEISEKWASNIQYFTKLRNAWEKDEASAFMYFLMNHDYSNRVFEDIPETQENFKQMRYSFDIIESLVYESLVTRDYIDFTKKYLAYTDFKYILNRYSWNGRKTAPTFNTECRILRELLHLTTKVIKIDGKTDNAFILTGNPEDYKRLFEKHVGMKDIWTI